MFKYPNDNAGIYFPLLGTHSEPVRELWDSSDSVVALVLKEPAAYERRRVYTAPCRSVIVDPFVVHECDDDWVFVLCMTCASLKTC